MSASIGEQAAPAGFSEITLERPEGVEVNVSGLVISHPRFVFARKPAGADDYEVDDRGASLSEAWYYLLQRSRRGELSCEARDYAVLSLARTDISDVLIRCPDGSLINIVREACEYAPRSRRSRSS